MTHPPAGPSSPPPPPGPKHDTIFALAASLGFKDLGRCGPQGVRPLVADSEGRAGLTPPGAVPVALPQPLGPPRFGDGPSQPGNPAPSPPQPFPPNPFPPPSTAVTCGLNPPVRQRYRLAALGADGPGLSNTAR